MSDHEHKWRIDSDDHGTFLVIDTYPEQYPYICACGAFTHDPATGEPCPICAPDDFAKRSPSTSQETK